MKKLLFSAVAAVLAFGASAQTSKEDVRIYINPGHGSWGPNNRHMATIGHNPISSEDPDTTDFYESNTNLYKGLALLEKLVEYGIPFDPTKNQTNENPNRVGAALDLSQNIVMSRVKSGPYPFKKIYEYTERTDTDSVGNPIIVIDSVLIQDPDQNNDFNRTLSTIAAEVEANNFDMFISIHSNAASEGNTTNYLYFAYDNKYYVDGNAPSAENADASAAHVAASVEMSRCGWNHRILDRHTQWSHYDYTMTKEDVAAGKGKIGWQNLGVLNHTVPGYLVEGYFHTYQPARHRAMNFDVDRLEGVDYARGVADYFGWEKENYGAIYGIVRDKYIKFSDNVYTPKGGTPDIYKPLNDVEVTLKDSEGNVVETYKTDVNYNGAFVFKKVQPGDYTVEFNHPAYKTEVYADNKPSSEPITLSVNVQAAKTEYPYVFLVDTAYVAPSIVYVNYPDSTAGKAGFNLLPSYETKATAYDILAENLADKTVRRQILRDDKLYTLAVDANNEPSVYVADLANNTVNTLGTTAAVGDIYKISDIALTADGYLVGINKCNQAYNGASNVTAYKWENDEETKVPTGELSVWWTNNFGGNFNAAYAGESVIYNGTLADGKMIYTASTTAANGNTRLVIVSISDGEYLGYMRNNQDGKYIATSYFGTDYKMTLSPRADDQIIFNSATVQPFEIQLNPTDTQVPTILAHLGEGNLDVASVGESYFKYAGKDLMVATNINEGKVEGIKLFNITDGLDNAKEIALEGVEIEPVECSYASAHGELALTLSATDVTTGATIELFVSANGNTTKFTCGDFYESVTLAKNSITGTANPYAYALKSEVKESDLLVSYSLNADAADVVINVLDEEGEAVATIEQGAQAKGAYTAEISLEDFEKGNYTWEVVVDGTEKSTIERYVSYRFYHPSGLDIDNNPENASFGTLFVAEGYNQGKTSNSTGAYVSAQPNGAFGGGLYIFDAAGNQILNKDGAARFYPSWLTNQDRNLGVSSKTCGADFGKVAIAQDGRIFVNRYNFSGDYYLVAESLEKLVADGEFTSLLAGKTMTNGIYLEGSEYLAGPAQSFDVFGGGEDLKLLALSRNDNTVDATFDENRVVEYNLGTGTALAVPTAVTALDQKYTISYDRKSNVQYDNRGGIWYIQYRGTPSASQPALIYVDANGEIKYFEGDGGKARYQGAISVSPDGDRLVASSASGVVTVYGIIRAENGDITLNEQYRLTHNMGGSAYSAAWDAAGNFFLGNATNEVVQGYALPRTEAAVTKAASKYAITWEGSSDVENITIDSEDAPVEYYNLQGVKVENPSNGIFIKVQGKKSEKVYIK